MKRGHVPIRQCIGCRRRRPAADLIRLKAVGDAVVVAGKKADLPGRGCYVCPCEPCIEAALKKGRLSRAFRRTVMVVPARATLFKELEQKRLPDAHVDR